jgi:hypothetical protein
MVFEPVGPLPASTYWRRRGVLLVTVLVLLLLLKSCVGGGDDPKKKTSATPTASPTASATTSPKPVVTRPPTRAPVAGAACADSALTLAVTTDSDSYPVGTTPKFTLTITNKGTVACTRDLGSKAVSLRVISGSARTWDSDDCSEGDASDVRTLAPGKAVTVLDGYAWSGKRSRPGCPEPREQAAPGTYQLTGTVGTLTSAKVVFHFR